MQFHIKTWNVTRPPILISYLRLTIFISSFSAPEVSNFLEFLVIFFEGFPDLIELRDTFSKRFELREFTQKTENFSFYCMFISKYQKYSQFVFQSKKYKKYHQKVNKCESSGVKSGDRNSKTHIRISNWGPCPLASV